jgi:glycosyltransferase involved in cell wall biosynthesis
MKRKILIVLTKSPFPAIDGTRERILNEIQDLQNDFELHLLIIGNETIKEFSIERLLSLGIKSIKTFKIKKSTSYSQSALALFSKHPLQSIYFWNKKAYQWLQNQSKEFHAICFHTVRFGRYIIKMSQDKHSSQLLLSFNDAISLNYIDAAKKAKGIWKYIYKIEAQRLKEYELKLLPLVDKSSITTERDRDFIINNWNNQIKKEAPKIEIIRNGIKDELFSYNHHPENRNLVFMGNLSYLPNKQGLKFFIKNILPLICAERKDVKLIIIGKLSKEIFAKIPNCIPLGFVDNPYEIIRKQALFINPADFGAGVPTKAITAMAIGIPVISTRTNAQGISGVEENNNIFIMDYTNIRRSADAIIKILDNEYLMNKVGTAGKKLIESTYKRSANYIDLKKFFE